MSEEVYGAVATEYYEKGWKSVLPLPPGEKANPPTAYTGAKELYPSYPDVMSWTETNGDGNVCIRLPKGVIGIDVDAYGGKSGDDTFIEAQNRWGALPPTVRSTSRKDGVSGIRLYRVPEEIPGWASWIKFPEMNLGGIEICQWSHRYVVCYPSVHPYTGVRQDDSGQWFDKKGNPTSIVPGDTYQWLNESGEPVGIPSLSDIPELPKKWVDALRKDNAVGALTAEVNAVQEIRNFIDGPMSAEVEKVLVKALRNLDTQPESRHDAAMIDVGRLVRLGYQGEPGVKVALAALKQGFVVMISDRANEFDASLEFDRLLKNPRIHQMIQETPDRKMDERVLGVEAPKPTTATSTPAPSPGPSESISEPVIDDAVGVVQDILGGSVEDEFLMTGEFKAQDSSVVNVLEEPVVDRSQLPFYQRVYKPSELGFIPPAAPLVDGILYRNTLAQISGDPGSYKSFFTLGLACAVASKDTDVWEGHRVVHPGTVIYVAAEGLSGMRVRTIAWCESNGVELEDLDLVFFPEGFDLGRESHITQVIEMVQHFEASLLVLDTRARVTGALKENDATEQQQAIDALDRIRESVNCTILAVHHSPKSGGGGRGSNAWDGAVWTELRGERKGDLKLNVHCEKHKDVESGCDHQYEMTKYVVPEWKMPETPLDQRTTLVCHMAAPFGSGLGAPVDTSQDARLLDLVGRIAGKGGLNATSIINAAAEPDSGITMSKNTIRSRLRALLSSGKLINADPKAKHEFYAVP